jgi:ABC-type polysaccharide/polyol phosphate export permease
MAGIVLNSFFNNGLTATAESIATYSNVLTKIYIPPQVFPLSVALAGLVNFFIGLIPLAIVVYISGQSLALTFPLVIFVGFFLSLLVTGLGLSLSLLFIRFDDTRNIVNVLLMIITYFTPIFYPVSILDPRLQKLINLNPLTSYLDCFRWAFSNNATATLGDWIYMSATGSIALFFGIYVFKKFWPRTVAML